MASLEPRAEKVPDQDCTLVSFQGVHVHCFTQTANPRASKHRDRHLTTELQHAGYRRLTCSLFSNRARHCRSPSPHELWLGQDLGSSFAQIENAGSLFNNPNCYHLPRVKLT